MQRMSAIFGRGLAVASRGRSIGACLQIEILSDLSSLGGIIPLLGAFIALP